MNDRLKDRPTDGTPDETPTPARAESEGKETAANDIHRAFTRGAEERNPDAVERGAPGPIELLDAMELGSALMAVPEVSRAKNGYLREMLTGVEREISQLTAQLIELGIFETLDVSEQRVLEKLRPLLTPADYEVVAQAYEEERTSPVRGQRVPPAVRVLLEGRLRTRDIDYVERFEDAIESDVLDALRRVLRGLDEHPEARGIYGRFLGLKAHQELLATQLEDETSDEHRD